jgi:molybdate transport system substrate-binding protein
MRKTQSAIRICIVGALVVFVVLSGCAAPSGQPSPASTEVRVLSAVGMRPVMLKLGPKFERATGHRLKISFNAGGVIQTRLEQGETADVVMINRVRIEQLAAAGKVVKGTTTDLATSRVGVAIRKGAPRPDISDPEAFKQMLLKARSIACPDPALGGSSGPHIAKMFERLGIAEAVKPKLLIVSTPEQERTMPGQLVADGKAEVALHQVQELLAVPGIDVVGPLPDDLQGVFVFSAAVLADSKAVSASKALIEFLRSPNTLAVIKATGMEPAAP